MNREDLRHRARALEHQLDVIKNELWDLQNNPRYDEDYKVETWHPHLTPEAFDRIDVHVAVLVGLCQRLLTSPHEGKPTGITSTGFSVRDILACGRRIWGAQRLTLIEVVVRLGVDYGKLCRLARGADKDDKSKDALELAMGNIIVSMIRWADDLDLDLGRSVGRAYECQEKFARENKSR